MMTNAKKAAKVTQATTVPAISPFDMPEDDDEGVGGGGVGRRLRGVNGPNLVLTESKVMVRPSMDMDWSSGTTCSNSIRKVVPDSNSQVAVWKRN